MKLNGRCAIITGANQGFGLAISRAYIEQGASVALCARDEGRLAEAVSQLKPLARSHQKILSFTVDVADQEQVKGFVNKVIKDFGTIDILVNNAGVYGPKGMCEDVDTREWVQAIEINLFGVFYMCQAVLPHMRKKGAGKVINLSGGGATAPLPRISAYAASKAAVVRLTETLAMEYREFGIDINAVAPGALNTRLLGEVLKAGPDVVGKDFYEKSLKQKDNGGTPLEKGASLCVYLGSSQSNGITGKLISAVWDPWEHLETYKADLNETDIYSLRRIVPEDRNRKWG